MSRSVNPDRAHLVSDHELPCESFTPADDDARCCATCQFGSTLHD